MRYLLFVGLTWFLSLGVQAQTIKVSNFLNPDAPVGRGSLALIEPTGDDTFTDVQLNAPATAPTTLGGVTVKIEGVPQRIQSVSSKSVVFLVARAGKALRSVELTTKFNVVHNTSIKVVSVSPGIPVQGTGDDTESFYPAGLWTIDPTGVLRSPVTSAPIPVGPRTNPTLVSIQAVGLRPGGSTRGISVRLNGIQCVVTSVLTSFFVGQEELSFQIPYYLAGNGVMDLVVTIDGRSSNIARLNLGTSAGLSAK